MFPAASRNLVFKRAYAKDIVFAANSRAFMLAGVTKLGDTVTIFLYNDYNLLLYAIFLQGCCYYGP
jgi:hypothetical protein